MLLTYFLICGKIEERKHSKVKVLPQHRSHVFDKSGNWKMDVICIRGEL